VKKTHFLHGVQMQDCSNVMDLPDPPSPADDVVLGVQGLMTLQKGSPEGLPPRRRRSLSGALPLRDSTTEHENYTAGKRSSDDEQSRKPLKKRHRKSLCHVASPAEPSSHKGDEGKGPSRGDINEKMIAEEGTKEGGASDACKPPNDSTLGKLGSHLRSTGDNWGNGCREEEAWNEVAEAFQPPVDRKLETQRKESPIQPRLGVSAPHIRGDSEKQQVPRDQSISDTAELAASLQSARELIHAYTSSKSKGSSQEETAVLLDYLEHKTGYVATRPDMTSPPESFKTEAMMHSMHLDLCDRLGPGLQHVDQMRKAVTADLQRKTGCRVEKLFGRYSYFLEGSNRPVSPDEYEEKYRQWALMKREAAAWGEHFDQLRALDAAKRETNDLGTKERSDTDDANSQPRSTDAHEVSNDDDEPSSIVNESDNFEASAEIATAHKAEHELQDKAREITSDNEKDVACGESQEREPASNKEITELEECNALPYLESVGNKNQATYAGCDEDSHSPTSPEVQVEVSHPPEKVKEESSPEDTLLPDDDEEMEDAPSESTSELLLPLPSRDETSSDPAIAAAEERLWRAIDEALATYSREVLALRSGRNPDQASE
jgi:hypothetical protein